MTENIQVNLNNISQPSAFIANHIIFTSIAFILIAILVFNFIKYTNKKLNANKNPRTTLRFLIVIVVLAIAGIPYISIISTQHKVANQSRDSIIKLLENKQLKTLCNDSTTKTYICGGDIKENNRVKDIETGKEYIFNIKHISVNNINKHSASNIKVTYSIEWV